MYYCNHIQFFTETEPSDPCKESLCGSNTQCNAGICTCLPEFFGNPYVGCHPECVVNTDCSRDKACIQHKCQDPCIGVCGINAECNIVNHLPMCSCPQSMSGNAFISCIPIQGSYCLDIILKYSAYKSFILIANQ